MATYYTPQNVEAMYARLGYRLYDDVNLFGVRSKASLTDPSGYYDLIGLLYNKNTEIRICRGTTVPCPNELVNPSFTAAKKDGTAVVKPGQYKGMYEIGTIGDATAWKHRCFRQVGPCDYYRDNTRDKIVDYINKQLGRNYSTHIHCGATLRKENIQSVSSAGCQEVADNINLQLLIDTCLKYSKGKTFTYTLFDEI